MNAPSVEPSLTYPILLVDDESQVYDILQQIGKVEFPQAQFAHITNYEDAVSYLDRASGWAPRLIILDIDLKENKSGLDVLSWVRASEKYALVPVVMLSVIHDEAVVRDAYARGANIFTNKPFDLDEWKEYIHFLRNYWFEMATTPKLWLE